MKKFVLFICSFIVLLLISHTLGGYFSTKMYAPHTIMIENDVSPNEEFGTTTYLPFLLAVLSATVAYLLAHKIGKREKQRY
mgnify:CR=1 FL=1